VVQSGACSPAYSDTSIITVLPGITLANAGADRSVCLQDTLQLDGNAATSGNGRWSQLSGPTTARFSSATQNNTSLNNLQAGSYSFVWTISNGVCDDSRDTVLIDISTPTVAGLTTGTDTVCAGSNSGSITLSGHTGNVVRWETSADGQTWNNVADTTTTQSYRNITTTTYYRALIQSGACGALYSNTSIVTVLGAVTAADAGQDRTLCVQDSIVLDGSMPVNGTGRWTMLIGDSTARISNASQPNTAVRNLREGTYNFIWTINNGACISTDTVSITLVAPPRVEASISSSQICAGQAVTLQATTNASRFGWRNGQQQPICNDCLLTSVSPTESSTYYIYASNQTGCISIDTVQVRVAQPIVMRAAPIDTICAGEQTTLRARGAATYTWAPATGLNRTDIANPVARPTATTTYTVIGRDAEGCFSDTATVTVVVGQPSQVSLGRDTTIMAGSTIQLNAQVTGAAAISYRWRSYAPVSCPTCPTPTVTVNNDACISCTVTNIYGCQTTDTVCVKTFCKTAQVFIPNAFSPDGDGINDKLYVMGTGINIVKSFRIFNRWGQLVFEKVNFSPNDPSYGWDGKVRGVAATNDIYVYTCEVVCENGTPYTYKGNVGIIN
jgi:gliding motility-associated-like protein